MAFDTALFIAGVVLVLAIVGVVLFVIVMGALGGFLWIAQRLERCPQCGKRGGLRWRNHWRETRGTPEGVRYPGSTELLECASCNWLIVRDSETGTRCISPDDEEEWQKWQES